MSAGSTNRLSGKHYFWLQLALVGASLVGLWLSHHIGRFGTDSSSRNVLLGTAAVVGVSLAGLGRAAHVIVTSAFSDSHRVFRSRHLLACSFVLFAAAVFAAVLAISDPFARVLSHGRITAEEVADVGSLVAFAICSVTAVVTAIGSWDAFHDERHWYRSLHRGW